MCSVIGECIHSSARYSLYCRPDKCKDELRAHMELEAMQKGGLCACVYLSVCKGRVGAVEGEGSTLYFSFLAYQPRKASPAQ